MKNTNLRGNPKFERKSFCFYGMYIVIIGQKWHVLWSLENCVGKSFRPYGRHKGTEVDGPIIKWQKNNGPNSNGKKLKSPKIKGKNEEGPRIQKAENSKGWIIMG